MSIPNTSLSTIPYNTMLEGRKVIALVTPGVYSSSGILLTEGISLFSTIETKTCQGVGKITKKLTTCIDTDTELNKLVINTHI